jgi:hypothetical protein
VRNRLRICFTSSRVTISVSSVVFSADVSSRRRINNPVSNVTFFSCAFIPQVILPLYQILSKIRVQRAVSQQLQYATRIFRKYLRKRHWSKEILIYFVKVVFGYFGFPLPIKLLHSSSTPFLLSSAKEGCLWLA